MIPEKVIKNLRLDVSKEVLVINAPVDFAEIIKHLPHDTGINNSKLGKYDFVQLFAESQSELEKLVKQVEKAGKYDCLFWASYPKGGGSIKSDIKRETVWKAFDLINLQAVSQISIDETWSALRARPTEKVGK